MKFLSFSLNLKKNSCTRPLYLLEPWIETLLLDRLCSALVLNIVILESVIQFHFFFLHNIFFQYFNSAHFLLSGLDYLGCTFNFIILSKVVHVNWKGNQCHELILIPSHDEQYILLKGCSFFDQSLMNRIITIMFVISEGSNAKLLRQKFILKRKEALTCLLPETQLGLGNANCIGLHSLVFMLSIHFVIISLYKLNLAG